ncbi:MAG: hypothetical protein AAF666_09270 [Pseudomonadota bacterium]
MSAVALLAAMTTAHTAQAAGTIEAYCLSKGDSDSACSCSQTVADEHLSTADQEQFVAIADNPSAFFALAAKGAEGEAFLERVTAFSEAREARCQ